MQAFIEELFRIFLKLSSKEFLNDSFSERKFERILGGSWNNQWITMYKITMNYYSTFWKNLWDIFLYLHWKKIWRNFKININRFLKKIIFMVFKDLLDKFLEKSFQEEIVKESLDEFVKNCLYSWLKNSSLILTSSPVNNH